MAELPSDREALEEYMRVWFRGEVPEMVELRSMAVRCRTQVSERILRRRRLIHHLENAKGCGPTSGWLARLKANQMGYLGHLGVVIAFVDNMYVVVRKKEKDVVDMDLCHLAIMCLDQHAHTLHHLESLLTISLDNLCLDNLNIFKEDLEYQSLQKSLSLYEL
ncbi:hypothetical protein Tco_1414215 [Tanacetum coccineum]